MRQLLAVPILCVYLVAPLLSQTGAGRAAFYEAPQLFVMTGYIANTTSGTWGTDFVTAGRWTPEKQKATLAAWNRGLGSAYDAEKTVLEFQRAGATGVIFYDKWHDGIVPHATQLTGFRTERDLVGPTIAALRKHNMKIVVYYSVGFDWNPEPKFLEWACRDAQGNPMGRAFPTDWMSFHSPYRQYVIDHLVEIMKMYGRIDGLWLDIFGQPEVSYDKYSKAAFQAKHGKPLEQATPDERVDFVIDTRRGFFLDIRKAVTAVQSDVSLTFNGAGMADIVEPKTATQVDALADFFSMEGHRVENIDRGARVGHNTDRPFEVGMLINSSRYVPMADKAPPAAMSDQEAIVSAATAWTQGSNVYAAMTPGHSGIFDADGDMRALRAIGGWLAQHKRFLVGSVPYADVAIVRGNPSPDLRQVPSLPSLWENFYGRGVRPNLRPGEALDGALRKGGYFTEFTGTAFPRRKVDWQSFRLLVIPENAVLDSATVNEIRNYVSAGGNLLAVGHASLFDQSANQRADFTLKEVFGVEYSRDLPGYKQFSALPASGIASSLPLNPPALGVNPTTGTVLAVWKSAGDAPAVVENRFGKGHCLYVSAAEIPTSASGLLKELTARLIGAPVVQVQSTRNYSFVMNRKGNDLLLYAMNRDTGSRAYGESGMAPDTTLTVGPEPIRLTLDTAAIGDIRRVDLLPGGSAVKMSRRAGSIEILVDASPSVTALRLRKD
jgi:hypothetical protein